MLFSRITTSCVPIIRQLLRKELYKKITTISEMNSIEVQSVSLSIIHTYKKYIHIKKYSLVAGPACKTITFLEVISSQLITTHAQLCRVSAIMGSEDEVTFQFLVLIYFSRLY